MTDPTPALPEALSLWITETCYRFSHLDKALLEKTFTIALKLAPDPNDISFDTSFSIVEQLLPLNSDSETISAAILYPFFNDNNRERELITQNLNLQIYRLLLGTKRMEAVDHLQAVTLQPKQLDNLRRMLLAIVDDIRIVLIKLAERIATLIQHRKAEKAEQLAIAKQTMALYAPLANRMGIGQFKWQLEDWSFRYLHTEVYNKISKGLKQRRADREHFIINFRHELENMIKQSHIEKYDLSGRAKHIYSIHRKIERKQVPLEEIYDTNAFRIIVPEVKDCYSLLSLLHEKFQHVPQEFDDYIAKPKPNGYSSIHTVVITEDNHNVEIQIRTFQMHALAELGVAAHWKYKEASNQSSSYEAKIELLQELVGWQQDLSQDTGKRQEIYQKLFEDHVYVFTPNNDVLDMPKGATPLDVAYHIHTEVGHRCKGAKLNNKIVPLTQKIQTGDVVEILTSKQGEPSRDWVNPERGYLATHSAIAKVKSWFRHQHQAEKLSHGIALWEKSAKREGLAKSDLTQLLNQFNFKTLNDLFIAIGSNNITVSTIIRKLKPENYPAKPELPAHPHAIKHAQASSAAIAGTQNLLTVLARCCHPIPGDNIIGYITQGRGVSIHRDDCQNFRNSKNLHPERILEVNWSDDSRHKYPINIDIEAHESTGLIRDISSLIANENIRLLGINSRVNKLENHAHINLTIEIESLSPLKKILTQIQQLPNVIKANRRR